ncbi:hypothetical protein PJW08_14430 [Tenacibaculum finnmarkense]|nr:hypothetical protein PJW08_14430 [Tenacibaculum finnmarkense]
MLHNIPYQAPHNLESWGDVTITKGTYSLMQPTISPLFNTRQLQDVLLKWSGSSVNYYDTLKEFWSTTVLNGASWNQALHDGFFKSAIVSEEEVFESAVVISTSVSELLKTTSTASGFELNLFSSTALGDGKQANNPWLQELPDPITRASWDNYLTVSMADAKELGFDNPIKDNGAINGNYATVTVNGVSIEKVPSNDSARSSKRICRFSIRIR